MLHLISLTLSGLALIAGQGSLPDLGARPNLSIIIVVYAGQFYPPIQGLIISFSLGYFLDILSGGLLGLNAFSMVFVCYLSFLISKKIVIQNRITQVVVIFSFYLVYGGMVYLLFRFFNLEINGYRYLKTTLWNGVATALLSLVIVSWIRGMERFFRFENERISGSGDIKI